MRQGIVRLGITLSLAVVTSTGGAQPQATPAAGAKSVGVLGAAGPGAWRDAGEAPPLAEPGVVPAIPDLVRALEDDDSGARWHAALALGSAGGDAVAPLIRALADKGERTRAGAALALGRIGPPAGAALPALVVALRDRDASVREYAAAALGALGPEGRAAVPALVEALADDDPYVNGKAAEALAGIGEEAVSPLVRALVDARKNIRWCAAIALGRMGVRAREAAPALAAALADNDENVRYCAAVALGSIGPKAGPAVPALVERLHDRDEDVRWAADLALEEIDRNAARRTPDWTSSVATIDHLTPELMKELHVPGVSIALVADRRLVWSRSYGVADARTSEPVTAVTRFEACSMSKPVFAYLVMKLVEDGRLALDRPLAEYLNEDQPPAQPEKRLITARMALTHTTGFPDWRKGDEEREGPLPVKFRPGSRFSYSGEGIFYLQRVVEHITGEPLDVMAQRMLFGPAGLGHMSYAWSERLDGELACGHTAEGTFLQKSRYEHPNAAYSLYTTAEDYARFILEIMKRDRSAGFSLSGRSIEAMLSHQVDAASRDPIERPGAARGVAVYRGLGWVVNTTEAGDIVHHSGSNRTGFRCFSQFNPSRGSAIVIMTNGQGGGDLWSRLISQVGNL